MKLLMENWRKFLNERMEFGDRFERWYHGEGDCEAQSVETECLLSHGFKQVGRGSFRDVWQLPDDPGYVMKVASLEYSKFDDEDPWGMNKAEADTIIQTGYPELLPKVYDTAKDYEWIVMEEVNPYDVEDEDWIPDFFPIFAEFWEAHKDDKNFAWRNDSLEKFWQDYTQSRIDEKRNKDDEKLVLTQELGGPKARGYLETRLPPLYERLLELIEQYDLAAWDIRGGNVGRVSDGRFVLLDLGWGVPG